MLPRCRKKEEEVEERCDTAATLPTSASCSSPGSGLLISSLLSYEVEQVELLKAQSS